jgi:hypothetical protein
MLSLADGKSRALDFVSAIHLLPCLSGDSWFCSKVTSLPGRMGERHAGEKERSILF